MGRKGLSGYFARADMDLSRLNDGPMGELAQYLDELRTSPEGLAALRSELADFCDKLPSELTQGEGTLGLDRPENLRAILAQVEQMLLHQLLSREEKS